MSIGSYDPCPRGNNQNVILLNSDYDNEVQVLFQRVQYPVGLVESVELPITRIKPAIVPPEHVIQLVAPLEYVVQSMALSECVVSSVVPPELIAPSVVLPERVTFLVVPLERIVCHVVSSQRLARTFCRFLLLLQVATPRRPPLVRFPPLVRPYINTAQYLNRNDAATVDLDAVCIMMLTSDLPDLFRIVAYSEN
jgi:hypothetical protein